MIAARVLFEKVKGRCQRTAARVLGRRLYAMQNKHPLISFTFDDFPRSALFTGGAILEHSNVAGTYYASLGLMGRIAPTGEIFHSGDVGFALERGHELGCHTFSHCHAYDTPSRDFELSILKNQSALQTIVPEAKFRTLSYPISCPRPKTKRRCAKYFSGCRGGGQTWNSGTIDLNNLSAFFIEQSRDNPNAIRKAIDSTARSDAWLIFATHDVCDNPTRFGCTPALLEEIVDYSLNSGAKVVSVSKALEMIGVPEKSASLRVR
jgi:peptidoglycan/xylan/chitin deacetylase (PgdA/CDA1 family)